MCLSLGGQTKDCGSSSERETATGAGAACPWWLQRPRSTSAPGLARSKGDMSAGSSPSPPATCGAWRQREPFLLLQPCGAPQCPCSPRKAAEQCPLSPLLRDGDGQRGIKGQQECRWWGSDAQCWGGTREGRTRSARAPQRSPFSAALCQRGAQRKQANQRCRHAPKKQGPWRDRLPVGRVQAHLPL